jgi:hypothetical protein
MYPNPVIQEKFAEPRIQGAKSQQVLRMHRLYQRVTRMRTPPQIPPPQKKYSTRYNAQTAVFDYSNFRRMGKTVENTLQGFANGYYRHAQNFPFFRTRFADLVPDLYGHIRILVLKKSPNIDKYFLCKLLLQML